MGKDELKSSTENPLARSDAMKSEAIVLPPKFPKIKAGKITHENIGKEIKAANKTLKSLYKEYKKANRELKLKILAQIDCVVTNIQNQVLEYSQVTGNERISKACIKQLRDIKLFIAREHNVIGSPASEVWRLLEFGVTASLSQSSKSTTASAGSIDEVRLLITTVRRSEKPSTELEGEIKEFNSLIAIKSQRHDELRATLVRLSTEAIEPITARDNKKSQWDEKSKKLSLSANENVNVEKYVKLIERIKKVRNMIRVHVVDLKKLVNANDAGEKEAHEKAIIQLQVILEDTKKEKSLLGTTILSELPESNPLRNVITEEMRLYEEFFELDKTAQNYSKSISETDNILKSNKVEISNNIRDLEFAQLELSLCRAIENTDDNDQRLKDVIRSANRFLRNVNFQCQGSGDQQDEVYERCVCLRTLMRSAELCLSKSQYDRVFTKANASYREKHDVCQRVRDCAMRCLQHDRNYPIPNDRFNELSLIIEKVNSEISQLLRRDINLAHTYAAAEKNEQIMGPVARMGDQQRYDELLDVAEADNEAAFTLQVNDAARAADLILSLQQAMESYAEQADQETSETLKSAIGNANKFLREMNRQCEHIGCIETDLYDKCQSLINLTSEAEFRLSKPDATDGAKKEVQTTKPAKSKSSKEYAALLNATKIENRNASPESTTATLLSSGNNKLFQIGNVLLRLSPMSLEAEAHVQSTLKQIELSDLNAILTRTYQRTRVIADGTPEIRREATITDTEIMYQDFVERCSGGSLVDWTARQRSAVSESKEKQEDVTEKMLKKTYQLLCLVVGLNDNGLIHPDIKPGNFVIDDSGELRISDIKTLRNVHRDLFISTSLLSEVSKIYAPPENLVLQEKAILTKEQVLQFQAYLIGISMYECVTGKNVRLMKTLKGQAEGGNMKDHECEWDNEVFKSPSGQTLLKILQGLTHKDPTQRMSMQEAKELFESSGIQLRSQADKEIKLQDSSPLSRSTLILSTSSPLSQSAPAERTQTLTHSTPPPSLSTPSMVTTSRSTKSISSPANLGNLTSNQLIDYLKTGKFNPVVCRGYLVNILESPKQINDLLEGIRSLDNASRLFDHVIKRNLELIINDPNVKDSIKPTAQKVLERIITIQADLVKNAGISDTTNPAPHG